MNKAWQDNAWEDYLYWQTQDKKTLKRINLMLKDIDRNAYDGLGKPEALSGNLAANSGTTIAQIQKNHNKICHMLCYKSDFSDIISINN